MNKNELVEAVARRVGDKRLAAASVEAVLDTVMRTVTEGEKVALSGFGVFEKADRAARSARNPSTGGTVELAATSVPRFRAGQVFKGVVSGARDLPPLPEPASPQDEQVEVSAGSDAPTGAPVRRRPRVSRTAGAGAVEGTSPATAEQDERSVDEGSIGEADAGGSGKASTGKARTGKKADGKKADGKKADGKKADGKAGTGKGRTGKASTGNKASGKKKAGGKK